MIFMLKKYVSVKSKVRGFLTDLYSDERGISPIIATVLIILVTVLLAVLVSDSLKLWVQGIINKFMNNADTIK